MSVGHVAGLFEAAGISTVIIAVKAFQEALKMMTAPRVLITPFLMGRTLGPPGNRVKQREVIMAALDLLEKAEKVGTMSDFPGSYSGSHLGQKRDRIFWTGFKKSFKKGSNYPSKHDPKVIDVK